MDRIEVLELEGQGRELGRAHGEALRHKIREFSERAYEVHRQNLSLKAGPEALEAYAGANMAASKLYAPELFEELLGIADGSGLGLEKIFFLNSFLELEDLRAPALGSRLLGPPSLWGCTTFCALPGATAENIALIGQNYDMERFYARYNVILKIRHPSGARALVYSLCGILGLNGLSSAGLGLVINKVAATDARPGVSYPFIVRKALSESRLGDAFGDVAFAARASGMLYQLASREGYGFALEVSATSYALLPFPGDLSVHTNHYLDPGLKKFESPGWLSHGGSYVRLEVARKVLGEQIGRITPEILMEFCRNHVNHPRCVCAHGFPGQSDEAAFCTIASVVMDLSAGKMLAAHGNPCRNRYFPVSLD
jgi:isopenicillin-N N-acyltransferase-like protein